MRWDCLPSRLRGRSRSDLHLRASAPVGPATSAERGNLRRSGGHFWRPVNRCGGIVYPRGCAAAADPICICVRARQLAPQQVPNAVIYDDPEAIFGDRSIDAVGLFTLADARPQQIRQALANRKHVLAEKPIGPDVATEWQLVREIEASDRLVAVNLFNRNAWYHKEIQRFIAEGEIGDLAVIRVCHMTPGHMPLEGHGPEGPPFHDCGMHY